MIGVHKCGQGWEYCDGNCATCAINHCTTTTGTNAQITIQKDYPLCLSYPKEQRKQTNADKIRAMTDMEIAAWLASGCDPIPQDWCITNYKSEGGCIQSWLEWLKENAKEDE